MFTLANSIASLSYFCCRSDCDLSVLIESVSDMSHSGRSWNTKENTPNPPLGRLEENNNDDWFERNGVWSKRQNLGERRYEIATD